MDENLDELSSWDIFVMFRSNKNQFGFTPFPPPPPPKKNKKVVFSNNSSFVFFVGGGGGGGVKVGPQKWLLRSDVRFWLSTLVAYVVPLFFFSSFPTQPLSIYDRNSNPEKEKQKRKEKKRKEKGRDEDTRNNRLKPKIK